MSKYLLTIDKVSRRQCSSCTKKINNKGFLKRNATFVKGKKKKNLVLKSKKYIPFCNIQKVPQQNSIPIYLPKKSSADLVQPFPSAVFSFLTGNRVCKSKFK